MRRYGIAIGADAPVWAQSLQTDLNRTLNDIARDILTKRFASASLPTDDSERVAIATDEASAAKLEYFDGASWQKLQPYDATLSAVSGSGRLPAANMPTGSVVQSASAGTTTYTSMTTTIPADDTIPQNTEGTQILSVSITPTSASNTIRVRVTLPCVVASVTTSAGLAVFRGGASAIRSALLSLPSTQIFSGAFEFDDAPATTSATTYTVRLGPLAAATLYLNGNAASRLFGGSMNTLITVEEIRA